MRIAIIGAGVSGLTAAYLLRDEHEIALYEKLSHIGGHVYTQDVALEASVFHADTGFTLFNEERYPSFFKLLKSIGASYRPAPRGFAVRDEALGLEFCTTSWRGRFVQISNFLRPGFHQMMAGLERLRRACAETLREERGDMTLGEVLDSEGYSPDFRQCVVEPLAAGVWTNPTHALQSMPFRCFAEFLTRHAALDPPGRPHWLVCPGGARSYAMKLAEPYIDRLRLNCGVAKVRRFAEGVEVIAEDGLAERYDYVIIATHADDALAMLADPSEIEQEVLSAFRYVDRRLVIHQDERLFPRRSAARAGWSLFRPAAPDAKPLFSYDLGVLHGGPRAVKVGVALDPDGLVDESAVLRAVTLRCPLDTMASRAAQARQGEINGRTRTSFCGAYWGLGLHEDGVNSALEVCRQFGKTL